MTRRQAITIGALCALAAVLAGVMLWRPAATPDSTGHAAHTDSHGHDDRHAAPAGDPGEHAGDGAVAMSEAQVRASGIGIETAAAATVRERLHLPAQVLVDAERSVAVAAPAPGLVQSVLVPPGALVRAGQGLFVLQSPEVARWRADDAAARQRLALAHSVQQREQKLSDEGISARQDLEGADAALREAEVHAQAARQQLTALRIAPSAGGASATLTVTAPLAGVVIDRPAVAGMTADAGKALLTIADLGHVRVEAAVPSDSLGQIAVGMPATVSAGALGEALHATVSYIAPVLGDTTRMATVRLTVPNPGLRLRPGMLATVDLLGQSVTAPVTVASDAVQTIHERSVVFVRTATGFEARTVTLGRSDGRRTAITRGLAPGAPYAAAGSYLLKADLGKAEAGHDD